MADRARSCGLTLRPGAFPAAPPPGATDEVIIVRPDAMGPLHESRKGFYRLLPRFIRPIGQQGPARTAVQRTEEDPRYRPPNLLAYLEGRRELTNVER